MTTRCAEIPVALKRNAKTLHQRLCKYFTDNGTCKFGEELSYIHTDNATNKEINDIQEELKNLNAAIMVLNSLNSINRKGILMI